MKSRLKSQSLRFLGVSEQPDFATVFITMYPSDKIIELKSLKMYSFHLRDIVVSYERLINIMYDHLMEVYSPERLRLSMICNPRGGISAKLAIDSDWEVRGGKEAFKDWTGSSNIDDWSVIM